MQPCFFHPY